MHDDSHVCSPQRMTIKNVSVDLSHDKVHAQDSGTLDKLDAFKRVITLTGTLDNTQRKRLLEIADKCPVHKILERSSEVVTELS